MSKLIVEMEMPLNCEHCPMSHWNKLNELTGCDAVGGKRYVSDDDEFWRMARPSWCPIIGELPEQHGRLGDLDRLAKTVNCARIEAMQEGSDTNPYWLLGDIIAQAKTIVPATERSEHERSTLDRC